MTRTSTNLRRWAALVLVLVTTFATLPLAPARPAAAAGTTFTVNTLDASAIDADLGDGVCDTAPLAPGVQCGLRAAIQQANARPGRDTIAFDIVSSHAVKSFRPTSPLPTITDPVVIDGYTQPGAKPNTRAKGTNAVLKIELDGSNAGTGAHGLLIEAPTTVVRGLAIYRFRINGVFVVGADRVRIEGCFLGLAANGTGDRGNGFHGVSVAAGADHDVVGGGVPGVRNLISGNGLSGVFIGTADSSGFPVGGRVEGNLIGTDKTGTGAVGNSGEGVRIHDALGATVGGNVDGTPNTIAFNGGPGVRVVRFFAAGPGNRILQNSIFDNGGEGIDLGFDGPTPNDPGDADAGPNNLQNKPVLSSATTAGGSTTIKGQLNSTPNRVFVLRFFSNPTGSEGKVFRGQLNVVTNANGNAGFTFAAASAVPIGQTVTATATSEGGDTSEFSVPRVAQ